MKFDAWCVVCVLWCGWVLKVARETVDNTPQLYRR